jgi:hypothetical protein
MCGTEDTLNDGGGLAQNSDDETTDFSPQSC